MALQRVKVQLMIPVSVFFEVITRDTFSLNLLESNC